MQHGADLAQEELPTKTCEAIHDTEETTRGIWRCADRNSVTVQGSGWTKRCSCPLHTEPLAVAHSEEQIPWADCFNCGQWDRHSTLTRTFDQQRRGSTELCLAQGWKWILCHMLGACRVMRGNCQWE